MNDFSAIKAALLQVYSFSEEQLTQFAVRLNHRKLRKKDCLLCPPQICNGLTFINSGSFRLYSNAERGELTITFFTEHRWAADVESLLTQQPTKNYIEAFEDSVIATITLQGMHELMDMYPCFRMLHGLIADLTIPTAHLAAISTKNPDERYKALMLEHPDWINRFPQMQIASYLGMTPETLSRVRARLA